MDNSPLSSQEQRRYARQIKNKNIGLNGQITINNSKVAVVGLCGIGIACSDSLLRAGLGSLVMIDANLVTESGLPSVVLLGSSDVGKLRCIAVRDHLHASYPQNKQINIYSKLPCEHNIDKLFHGCSVIIDTCRGAASTFSTLDYADKNNIPVIIAYSMLGKSEIGLYGKQNREQFRAYIAAAYANGEMCMCQSFCFGYAAAAIGSTAAGYAIRYLFKIVDLNTKVRTFDLIKDEITKKDFY